MRRPFTVDDSNERAVAQILGAGVEARAYVIGGMHPAAADPQGRDALVKFLVRRGQPQLAAEAIRGWVEHHPEGGACRG